MLYKWSATLPQRALAGGALTCSAVRGSKDTQREQRELAKVCPPQREEYLHNVTPIHLRRPHPHAPSLKSESIKVVRAPRKQISSFSSLNIRAGRLWVLHSRATGFAEPMPLFGAYLWLIREGDTHPRVLPRYRDKCSLFYGRSAKQRLKSRPTSPGQEVGVASRRTDLGSEIPSFTGIFN